MYSSWFSCLFFHFDEVGDMVVDDLRALRNPCWSSFVHMKLDTCFPFFFFSGRGAAYNQFGSAFW